MIFYTEGKTSRFCVFEKSLQLWDLNEHLAWWNEGHLQGKQDWTDLKNLMKPAIIIHLGMIARFFGFL